MQYTATLLDLMRAYAQIRTKDEFRPFVLDREHVYTMEQALDRMRGLIGYVGDWATLVSFLPEGWDGTPMARRSSLAAVAAGAAAIASAVAGVSLGAVGISSPAAVASATGTPSAVLAGSAVSVVR